MRLKVLTDPMDIDNAELKADLDSFARRMRFKWHFKDNVDDSLDVGLTENGNKTNKFSKKSSWKPLNNDTISEAILSQLEKEVLSLSTEGRTFPYLFPNELTSLRTLKSDRNVVINEADKGSAVVVWDREDYIREVKRQLGDIRVYEEIDSDLSVDLNDYINDSLNDLRVEDPELEEVIDFLKVKVPKLARFYLLSKISKGLSNVEGRLVISNCGAITENISAYLDYHLNPLVSLNKSYVKDTNHFLSLSIVYLRMLFYVLLMLLVFTLVYRMEKVYLRFGRC